MRALVTGAASGLGRALADALAHRGDHVVAVDIEPVSVDAGIESIVADLSDRDAVSRLMDRLDTEAPFDLVIMNAGANATGRFEAIPAEIHGRLTVLNIETPIIMTNRLLEKGSLANGATLVFVSSLSHKTGYPGASVYAATKDAMAVFASSVRKPLKRKNMHVLTVFPGPIDTGHAARHAPPGASAANRMPADRVAATILEASRRRKKVLYPGSAATVGRIAGTLFPVWTTRFMRRALFGKMDREVY